MWECAKQATSTIPIVRLAVANPERQGLITSLAHPGGNEAGTSNHISGETSDKMLQAIKESVPKLSSAFRETAGS